MLLSIQGLQLIREDGIPWFGTLFLGKGLYSEEECAAGLAASAVIRVSQVLSHWL